MLLAVRLLETSAFCKFAVKVLKSLEMLLDILKGLMMNGDEDESRDKRRVAESREASAVRSRGKTDR